MLQAQCWMLGTGPGIFPFFSRFPQVSRWGSRAPSSFDLGLGDLFSLRKLKKKKSCWFPHVILQSCSEKGEKKGGKKVLFFKEACSFFLRWNAGNTHSLMSTGLKSAHIYIMVNQQQFDRGHWECSGRQLPSLDAGSALQSQALQQDQPPLKPQPQPRLQSGDKWM